MPIGTIGRECQFSTAPESAGSLRIALSGSIAVISGRSGQSLQTRDERDDVDAEHGGHFGRERSIRRDRRPERGQLQCVFKAGVPRGTASVRRSECHTVIYELHVKGFTRHVNSGVAPSKRGTYAGLIEKVPYLKDLGVTAVELLPVFQFDPQDAPAGTTGAISRFHSSRHITRTARSRTPSPFLTNFGTWSKRSTARKSKSFSMSSLITPQKVA